MRRALVDKGGRTGGRSATLSRTTTRVSGQGTRLIIKPRHNGIPLIPVGGPVCIGGGCGGCGGEWDYPRVVYRNIGHVISMLNPSLDYCAKSPRRIIYPLTTRVCTRHRSPRSCGPPNCFLQRRQHLSAPL